MVAKRGGMVLVAVAIACILTGRSMADPPKIDPVIDDTIKELIGLPKVEEFKVRVVDQRGEPVANAKVIPWALRSSQGHGWWRTDDKAAKVDPQEVITDDAGIATVLYPHYRYLAEQIRTTSVSLYVDHPDFAYDDDLHIDVPLETDEPYVIELADGMTVELRPTIDGKPTDLDDIHVMWSDGRSWLSGAAPQRLDDGALRIGAMPPGKNSVLLVKLDGEQATHFSRIVDFELSLGEPAVLNVELQPSVRVRGKLGDNVPRPVNAGRMKARTLKPSEAPQNRVGWLTWTPIQADGTFAFDWPADEPVQLIALCEGFSASSGTPPEGVAYRYEAGKDPFSRPQVFQPDANEQIELAMTPLVRCVATAVDEDEAPVAGVTVSSWPNVCWWNDGSQVYCHPLARGERLARQRDYFSSIDKSIPYPFKAETDAQGKAILHIPAGDEELAISSEVYELPVFLGGRDVRVKLNQGETSEVMLRLQPRGTDKLGEWDKLAGVVFGCSTREGRRILRTARRAQEDGRIRRAFSRGQEPARPATAGRGLLRRGRSFCGSGRRRRSGQMASKSRRASGQNRDGQGAGQLAARTRVRLRPTDAGALRL